MDQNSVQKYLAKAQKFGNFLDSLNAEFNEFAEKTVGHLNEVVALLRERDELKAKVAELEKKIEDAAKPTQASSTSRPAVEIAKAIDAAADAKPQA
jgi:uncharacterized coiled-coil DUF342 family protein